MRTRTLAGLATALGFALVVASPLAAQDRQEMGNEAPKLSDANIAAIVVAANQADIDNGRLAVEKGTNERVRAFGQQMIEAHTAVNEAAGALLGELGVSPEANEISRSIAGGQAAERERIAELEGAAFDRAYITNEIAYHEAVIQAVDGALIPSATNERLKQTLIDVRPAFVAHLEQAKSIQAELDAE